MSRDSIRIRMNPERELQLEKAMEALGEDEAAAAIERALRHTAQSKEAYDEIKRELTPEQAETLSTDEIRINHYPQVRV